VSDTSDIQPGESASDWQKKGRTCADEYLQPHELQAEPNGGYLPDRDCQA
jgi:hypothetical protein